jgi:HEAT repeat protein
MLCHRHPRLFPVPPSFATGSRVAVLVLAALLAAQLPAHGGQFRGPGEVVPPASGGGGSTAGGSSGPSSGGPSSPGGGGAGAPGAGAPSAGAGAAPLGTKAARGVQLDDDLTRWEFWWEFSKDPHLRLRESMRTPRAILPADGVLGIGARDIEPPTTNDADRIVIPALHRALLAAGDRDTISGCLVALAKIGRDLPNARLRDLFCAHLKSHDQEIRETSAVCLGIAAQATPEDVDLLLALARDTEPGRTACGRASVDERTRAFAAYGLGLLLARPLAAAERHRVVTGLLPMLDPGAQARRDVMVATIAALGQMRVDGSPAGTALVEAAVAALAAYYLRDLGPGEQLVQSHCPPALARLLGGQDPARAARHRSLFAEDLAASLGGPASGRRALLRSNHHIAQSCAIALGGLCGPWEDDKSPDHAIAELLLRCWREHKDHQTRHFAVLALGRMGGERSRTALLAELAQAGRSVEKPWAALALATLVGERQRGARAAGRTLDADPVVGAALTAVLDEVKNPSTIGATAIAIGLCQHRPAADQLRKLLEVQQNRDDVAGQLAIALALLEEHRARGELRALLAKSVRRPQVLVQTAMALGRLGDAAVIDDLTALLADGDSGLARLSAIAMALGQIGDRRSIAPLIAMLGDARLTPLTRAFAAVALGGVCDKAPLPWNATYAASLNYRAAVETLTDGAAGILDIL